MEDIQLQGCRGYVGIGNDGEDNGNCCMVGFRVASQQPEMKEWNMARTIGDRLGTTMGIHSRTPTSHYYLRK